VYYQYSFVCTYCEVCEITITVCTLELVRHACTMKPVLVASGSSNISAHSHGVSATTSAH
jgi:hypothetical protein